MRVVGIIADLHVADIESAKDFYSGYLGLSNEEFNMGWVARFTSPDTGANVQLVTHDAAASEDPVISVKVDDVDTAYEHAQQRGYEIVHPLSTEPWGVRRFFVRAPDGNVLNIVQHRGTEARPLWLRIPARQLSALLALERETGYEHGPWSPCPGCRDVGRAVPRPTFPPGHRLFGPATSRSRSHDPNREQGPCGVHRGPGTTPSRRRAGAVKNLYPRQDESLCSDLAALAQPEAGIEGYGKVRG